jgi:hypothetical protein
MVPTAAPVDVTVITAFVTSVTLVLTVKVVAVADAGTIPTDARTVSTDARTVSTDAGTIATDAGTVAIRATAIRTSAATDLTGECCRTVASGDLAGQSRWAIPAAASEPGLWERFRGCAEAGPATPGTAHAR